MEHYKVTLSEQERAELQDIAGKGTHAASKVINARQRVLQGFVRLGANGNAAGTVPCKVAHTLGQIQSAGVGHGGYIHSTEQNHGAGRGVTGAERCRALSARGNACGNKLFVKETQRLFNNKHTGCCDNRLRIIQCAIAITPAMEHLIPGPAL